MKKAGRFKTDDLLALIPVWPEEIDVPQLCKALSKSPVQICSMVRSISSDVRLAERREGGMRSPLFCWPDAADKYAALSGRV